MTWSLGELLLLVLALSLGVIGGWLIMGRRRRSVGAEARREVAGRHREAAKSAAAAAAAPTDPPTASGVTTPTLTSTTGGPATDPAPVDQTAERFEAAPATDPVAPAEPLATVPAGATATPADRSDTGPAANPRAAVPAAGEPVASGDVPSPVASGDVPAPVASGDDARGELHDPTAAIPSQPTRADAQADSAHLSADTAAPAAPHDAPANVDRTPDAVATVPAQAPAEVMAPAEALAVADVPATAGTAFDAAGDGPGDDFRRIPGVGPKVANALNAAGIRTFAELAESDEATLRAAMRSAGVRSAPSLPTWAGHARELAGAPAATAIPRAARSRQRSQA